ncbi:hypothetical protein SAMN04488527_1284 [Aliiroseovarius crassostreae]|uniref:Mitochondrial inner membrane protein n=1 Tax=Aliiroseovarius crassostreae TaxID=154981 RepID=A0A0N8IBC9_9RHOB|nr:hypothetical protein [Aliiroseovarius crassostreae]KPN62755.1 hypothetical protein AKJ29_00855 [Aliiroseovarius crassostreae]SFU88496.1 hypothetical protein SAMN04488527_1284 [Aliiroseovarius crassostreae]
MANSRKPAKGASKATDAKAGKTVKKSVADAVVIEEKAAETVKSSATPEKTTPSGPSKAQTKASAKATKGAAGTPANPSKTPTKPQAKSTTSSKEASLKSDDAEKPVGEKAAGERMEPKPDEAKDTAQSKPIAKPSATSPAKNTPQATAEKDEKSAAEKPKASSDQQPSDQQKTPVAAPSRSSTVLPLLFGGAIAAVIGFGAARYPDQWPFVMGPVEDPLATALATQGQRLEALEVASRQQAETLASLQADNSLDVARGEISGEFAQLRTQLEAMNSQLSELENRLHTVEKLPQGSGMEAAAAAATAYERELQQMRQMLDAELAKITDARADAKTLEQNAAEAAKAAGARAALARVLAALDTGRPFGDALFDLSQQAGIEAPVALSKVAEKGVPTLVALQSAFPEAARAALDASIRSAVAAGEMDRVSAFFRLQLGTRSLSPKEGADPDAILSRAEAALKTGQLEAALAELATMPEAGQSALGDWIAAATTRKDALTAGDALAQLVNSK